MNWISSHFHRSALLAALVTLAACSSGASPAGGVAQLPAPAVDQNPAGAKGKQTAVLSGGCFWCAEAVFEQLAGVTDVTSGYAGGLPEDAHYEMVGSGKTSHAESIRITFDPSKITYGTILRVFFGVAHDPTTKDRQGPDWGHQYRSAIWYKDAEQERIARAYVQQLTAAKAFKAPIVTEISPLKGFYAAEEYHQDYVRNHPTNPYVVANSLPKLEKLKKTYPELLKKK